MKTNELFNKIGSTFNKAGYKLKKRSPEILIATGIVGFIGSTVLAIKATIKAIPVINETKKELSVIEKAKEDRETLTGEKYSLDDYKKDTKITLVKTGVQFIKLYTPAVVLSAMSVANVLASHSIMKKRCIAFAAAYTAADKAFKEYRGRVATRFGDEIEKELRYGIKALEIEEPAVAENGAQLANKKTTNIVDEGWKSSDYSIYARVFDQLNDNWRKDPYANRMFILARQEEANMKLKWQGHLFLNEVYDMLGFPRTKAGAVVGWIYDLDKPCGDNFVDFGITEITKQGVSEFVNGYEAAVLLDFNVTSTMFLDEAVKHQYGW